jgi:molybdenum cofactor synthesis domain-containing protein
VSVFAIVESALDPSVVIAAVSHPSAGGIDVFLGAVRDHNDGLAVTRLEYEAYGRMAVAEMERIADEIRARWPDVRLAAVHRVGALVPGDLAVVCAASAVHRGEAFTACRELIDQIKARVPIWKREHGPDGPYWVGWQDARCAPDHGHDHSHDHSHGHGHDHAHDHAKTSASATQLRAVVVTVSDTRTKENDSSGAALRSGLEAAGHAVVAHEVVRDELDAIRGCVSRALDNGGADVVLFTGGTGIAPRDQTVEALESMVQKRLDGFGEAFRARSWEQVGARAMLSRAFAGTYQRGLVIALPGSTRAVQLALTELVLPVLSHAVDLLRGRTAHS